MDVSANAPTFAAALMHSAFNIASAIGSCASDLIIAAGFEWTTTAWPGAFLTFFGLVIFIFSWVVVERKFGKV